MKFLQLEDIRQKRAAERLSKISSGPDLTKSPNGIDYGFVFWCFSFLNIVFLSFFLMLLLRLDVPVAGIRKSESANRLSEVLIFLLDFKEKNGLN